MTATPDKATLAMIRMALAGTDNPDRLAEKSAGFRVAAEAFEIACGLDCPDMSQELFALVQREAVAAELGG